MIDNECGSRGDCVYVNAQFETCDRISANSNDIMQPRYA